MYSIVKTSSIPENIVWRILQAHSESLSEYLRVPYRQLEFFWNIRSTWSFTVRFFAREFPSKIVRKATVYRKTTFLPNTSRSQSAPGDDCFRTSYSKIKHLFFARTSLERDDLNNFLSFPFCSTTALHSYYKNTENDSDFASIAYLKISTIFITKQLTIIRIIHS